MVLKTKGIGVLAPRLILLLALLGGPSAGFAAGTWSVIPLAPPPDAVHFPAAVAVVSAGNLYVAEVAKNRIRKRDGQGNWSWIASGSFGRGQVGFLSAVAVDTVGNLYIAAVTRMGTARIRKRDAQGNWSDIATYGAAPSQVLNPKALAADSAGNLY